MNIEAKLKHSRKQLQQRKRKPIAKHVHETMKSAGSVYRLMECIAAAAADTRRIEGEGK